MSGIVINPYSFAAADAFSTKSLNFDGVDDYVSCGNNSSLMPTTALSISFWMEGVGSGDDFALRCGSTTLSNNYGYGFRVVSSTDYWFILGNGSTSSSLRISSPAPSAGWHHFLCTWDGTTQTMFIDGASVGTATFATTLAYDAGAFFIGGRSTTGSKNFEGNIDEVAIWNSDQSGNVSTIYNSGTPADLTSLSPTAWWRMGENATFKSPQILMPEQNNKDKVSNFSMDFDGTNDYVSISNGSAVNITGNGSISFWINAATLANYTGIVSKVENTASVVSNAQYHIGMLSNGVRCVITGTDLKIGSEDVGTVPTITTGVWEHYVLTWDGSNLSLYKNGVFAASKTQVSSPSTNTEPVLIGYRNGYDYVDGKIDEVSIFNTVLSAGDVTAMYNSGEPTDLTSLSPSAWWRMGEEAIFNSTNWLLPNKAQDVYSRYSMAFDGVDDYVDCGNDSSLHNSNFTISAWVYQPSTSGSDEIISNGLGAFGAKDHGFNINRYYGNYRFYMGDGTTSYSSSWAGAVVDTWQHLFMSYDGTDMKTYLNGVLKDTVAVPSISYSASAQNLFRIGKSANSGLEFTGNIDEVSLFDSAKAIGDLWDGSGKPTDLTGQSGLVSWWRMGEDATFSTNWTIPDKAGSNTGTSANMTNDDLTGNAPGVTANGVSANMTIEDRTGDAPDSSNNALSYNMVEADIVEDTP